MTENKRIYLAYLAGFNSLQSIIETKDFCKVCVVTKKEISQDNPDDNVFIIQHKSGYVITLVQRVTKNDIKNMEISWILLNCKVNNENINLTNLRRHQWSDYLVIDNIPEKKKYEWFRFNGKKYNSTLIRMHLTVNDDSTVDVHQSYSKYGIRDMLLDIKHIIVNLKQPIYKNNNKVLSYTLNRKQMIETIKSVLYIENLDNMFYKIFDSSIFSISSHFDDSDVAIFDELNYAKVDLTVVVKVPSLNAQLVFFHVAYSVNINLIDYSVSFDENQAIKFIILNMMYRFNSDYQSFPYTVSVSLLNNQQHYTGDKNCYTFNTTLNDVTKPNQHTGKSVIEEFVSNYHSVIKLKQSMQSLK